MENGIIYEKGVVRMTARQLSTLWLEVSDRCGVDDIIDIRQPDTFTEQADLSIYEYGRNEGEWLP